MQTTERKISELIPAEYNPRQLSDKQHEDLKASLTRFGAVDPAIVNIHPDRKDIIVGGHQRLKVAKSLGWETFPCVEVNLTRDQERELNVRLNKNTGSWDWGVLAHSFEVDELQDWGFTDRQIFSITEIEPEPEVDLSRHADSAETYLNNTIRQIVLHYDVDSHKNVLDRLKQIQTEEKLDSNSEVIQRLINLYFQNK